MKITYLGTAAAEGIPALFCRCELCRRAREKGGREIRLRSSVLINDDLMLDLGPDINMQRLQYGVDLSRLKAVLVTHSHSDHWDVQELTRRSVANYCHIPGKALLEVYADKKAVRAARRALEEEFGTEDDASLCLHVAVPGERFSAGGLRVTALAARHDPAEECLCWLLQDSKSSFLLANDTALLPQESISVLKQALCGCPLSAVSMDCTFGAGAASSGHMNIAQNAQLRELLLQQGCADGRTRWLSTHFSHNCGMLHEELEAVLKVIGFEAACDGLSFSVGSED